MNINGNLNITNVTSGSSATEILVYNSGNIERRSTLPQSSITLSARLAAWDAYNSNGFVVQTSSTTWINRSIAGTIGQITVSNNNGTAGNPTISIDSILFSNISLWRTGSAGTNNIRTNSGFNDVTGNNSICTGGTAGNTNSNSGQQSGIIGGYSNIIASDNSCILGGVNNNITTPIGIACILGGINNTNIGDGSIILGGAFNTSTRPYSVLSGVNTIGHWFVEKSTSIGQLSSFNAQCGDVQLSNITSNATSTRLTTGDGLDGLAIPAGTAFIFDFIVQATITSVTNRSNTRAWQGKYMVKNVGGTMTASVVQNITSSTGETGTTTFSLTASSFSGSNYLFVVTGTASTTVSWLANIRYNKIQFV